MDDVDNEAEDDEDDDAVGGEDDRDVELELAEATSDDPFDEFPLELAAQLTRLETANAVVALLLMLLLLSTTSVSFSIRWRLMTGCPLLVRFDDEDGDVVDGVDIMATSVALVEDEVGPLLSVTIATVVGGGPVGGGSKGPRPFFGSFSFWRTMECCL